MSVDDPHAGRSVFPLRPLATGEVLDATVTTIRTYPRVTLVPPILVYGGLAVLVAVFTTFVLLALFLSDNMVLQTIGGVLAFLGLSAGQLLSSAGQLVLSALLSCLMTGTVARAVLGRPTPARDAWRDTKSSFGWLLLYGLLLGLVGAVVYMLAVTPAIFLPTLIDLGDPAVAMVMYGLWVLVVIAAVGFLGAQVWLAPAVIVVEGVHVFKGIARSWQLTATSRFRITGLLLLAALIGLLVWGAFTTGVGSLTAYALQLLTFSLPGNVIYWVYVAVVVAGALVASAVMTPFMYVTTAVVYFDYRSRAEGFDLVIGEARTAGVFRDLPVTAAMVGPGTVFAGPDDHRPPRPPPGHRPMQLPAYPPTGPSQAHVPPPWPWQVEAGSRR